MQNKFLSSTLILIIGGFITKILGFVMKIIYTRILTEEGIGYYSLVIPTYSLLISIATLAMPIVISKIVSEGKTRSVKVMSSSIVLIIGVNVFLLLFMLLTSRFIACTLLKNDAVYPLLIALSFTLPFISISSIVKGYFFGKQRMIPYVTSNILEQLFRFILLLLFLPYFVRKSVLIGVMAFLLFNIFSECFSILVFFCFLPKKCVIHKDDIKPDLPTIKEILNVSIPTVSSKFIGNIGFFFEPIMLTHVLLAVGYSNSFILKEYGAYNAYSIGLLTLPSFFIAALSNALIPEISKYYYQRNMKFVKRRFNQALIFSGLLGIAFTIPIFIFRDSLLWILYRTRSGSDYIKILSPFFVLFYLEAPLISTLQGLGEAKYTMKITFYGVLIKSTVLVLFSFLRIGIYGLIISEIVNIIFVVTTNFLKIRKTLR